MSFLCLKCPRSTYFTATTRLELGQVKNNFENSYSPPTLTLFKKKKHGAPRFARPRALRALDAPCFFSNFPGASRAATGEDWCDTGREVVTALY